MEWITWFLGWLDAHNGGVNALGTLVIAIFTIVLALATIELKKLGEKQGTDMQASIAEARRSADAAGKAADAAILGQRAFVQITPTWSTDRNPRETGSPLQYNFGTRMDNFGNTAAQNLRNHITFEFFPGAMPDDFQFPDYIKPLTQAGILGPKQMLLGPHIPSDRFVTADEIAQIQAEKIRLYFFGWVRYFDGYPGTPERITKFCYFVRVTGNPDVPVVFIPHSRHNCADDGCNE